MEVIFIKPDHIDTPCESVWYSHHSSNMRTTEMFKENRKSVIVDTWPNYSQKGIPIGSIPIIQEKFKLTDNDYLIIPTILLRAVSINSLMILWTASPIGMNC